MDEGTRDRVERLQWELGRDLLRLGNVVIIEWGTWGRGERDRLRIEARGLGARTELIFLNPPLDELWRRIVARQQEDPPIPRAELDRWDAVFERPDAAEAGAFDAVSVIDD